MEPHHGTSILAITVFDFDESEVGEYGEVVYAVIVPPLVRDGRLPKSAFFPWQVATTTAAARAHAIERWFSTSSTSADSRLPPCWWAGCVRFTDPMASSSRLGWVEKNR